MSKFNEQERDGLYALFRLDEHEIREGATSKDKQKVQWFCYVRREAIQVRLDKHFFGEWELYFLNPAQPAIYHKDHVDCSMGIAIRGVRREYNGSQSGVNENGAKGAATDALKRVASLWGIGLYLQDSPQIWTEGYKDTNGNINWDKKKAVEAEAMRKVGAWLKSIGAHGESLYSESAEEKPSPANKLDPEAHGLTKPAQSALNPKDWEAELKKLVNPLYKNINHRDNGVKAALQNGEIQAGMEIRLAAAILFAHRAKVDFGAEYDEVTAVLGKQPQDLIQTSEAFGAAWNRLKQALKQTA